MSKPIELISKEECKEVILGGVWQIQTLSECVKWLGDVQAAIEIQQDVNGYNTDKANGGWYIGNINSVLASSITAEADKIMQLLDTEI